MGPSEEGTLPLSLIQGARDLADRHVPLRQHLPGRDRAGRLRRASTSRRSSPATSALDEADAALRAGREDPRQRQADGAAVTTTAEKGAAFRALHEGEPFVDPQPVGRRLGEGARVAGLQGAGDDQLRLRLHDGPRATARSRSRTSCGTRGGRRGDRASRVAVDLENGHGPTPGNAAAAIAPAGDRGRGRRLDRGLRPRRRPRLRPRPRGRARSRRRRRWRRRSPFDFTLTARAEQLIRGKRDLDDTIARLAGVRGRGRRRALRARAARASTGARGLRRGLEAGQRARPPRRSRRREMFEAGAQRVSVGGALTWVAVAALTTPRRRCATATCRSSPRALRRNCSASPALAQQAAWLAPRRAPPAIAGRITSVSDSDTVVSARRGRGRPRR